MTEFNPLPSEEISAEDMAQAKNAFPLTESIRQAALVSQLIGGNSLAFTGLGFYLAIQTGGAWQAFVIMALSLIPVVGGFVAANMIKHGQPSSGGWVLFTTSWIAPALAAWVIADFSYVSIAYILITCYFIIRYAMPVETRRAALINSALVLLIPIAVPVIDPAWPLVSSLMLAIAPILTAILAVALAVLIALQAWAGSLRNKLMVGFIGLALVISAALGAYVYITSTNLTQANLEKELTQHADGTTTAISDLIHEQVTTLTALSLNEVLQQAVEESNQAYSGDAAAIQAEMEAKDAQWRAADAANNNADSLVQEHLTNAVALDLIEFQQSFPEYLELFITDVYGGLAGTSNRTSDYYQADEDWWQAAYNNGEGAVYISNPIFDESTGLLAIQIALPLKNRDTGEVVGILRTSFNASELITILDEKIGQTGETDIFIPGEVVTHFHEGGFSTVPLEEFEEVQAIAGKGMLDLNYEEVPSVIISAPVTSPEGNRPADKLGWVVLFHQQHDEAFAPVTKQTRGVLLVISIVIILAVAFAYWLAQLLVRPILNLTATAETVSEGDLSGRADESSSDEIGTLARVFNAMTSQLQNTLLGLEKRVEERTSSLELAAKVGQTISQVTDLDSMLTQATELMLEQFDLYYVQIYLTDPSQTTLKLEAGTGEVGKQLLERGHSLQLNTGSLNGRAAVERRAVVISDTAESLSFRPNPLLPDTRGEMALPLIVGEKVVGVLDLQTRYPGKLTEELVPAYEALAGQLAVAIQNANLLAEAEQARAEVEKQARRQIRVNWDEHLDAIHTPENFGYIFNRSGDEISPLTESDETPLPEGSRAVSAPISLTGEELGSLVVEMGGENKNEQAGELVNIVARQVAQQIENLRLLESAERYRREAEEAARRQTIEGWQAYITSRSGETLGYMYDRNKVIPHSSNGEDDATALTLQIKANDEPVGKLSVQGLALDDRESFELANSVAERLGAHIENLRLFEETRRGQIELDKRARELAAVAAVSTASSQELDVEKMLTLVVELTQRQFNLYHAHVFTYNEFTEQLEIVACGWKAGDEHEGTHGTTTISLAQEQSLVARAARTKQVVVVNDVQNEPGFLPNAMLPDTKSEMAVPLMVGNQLLGVLDVQKDYLNAFTQEDVNIKTTLATQVAIALQNAYSFARSQKQAERETMLNAINQKIQSATSVEAVLQIAARELGHALGAPMTIAQLSIKGKN